MGKTALIAGAAGGLGQALAGQLSAAGWIVFAATVLIFVLTFFGLAYSLYPYIVIDRLTVWEAASAPESLAVIAVGVAITVPAIIVYTIFMYRVFWGKARELTYGL